jgi:hypothetical protein
MDLEKIAQGEGYSDFCHMAHDIIYEYSAPIGVCGGCRTVQPCHEPDAIESWCENCEEPAVTSVLVIAGRI